MKNKKIELEMTYDSQYFCSGSSDKNKSSV